MNRENGVKKPINKFFAKHVVEVFREFEYKVPKNVTLVSDDEGYGNEVQFHKEMLVVCSDYFKKLFHKMRYSSYSSEKKEYVIPMEGCSFKVLRRFKEFLYTGEVDVKEVVFVLV